MAKYPLAFQTDTSIWLNGVIRSGGELGFLRALHHPSGLKLLTYFLALNNPALKFRLSSIWLDKFPICKPSSTSGCSLNSRELGDLGILVRGRVNGKPYVRFRILQAKVYSKNWKNLGSSSKEIELYENCPEFELYTSGKSGAINLGTFDLKAPSCFNSPPYTPGGFPFWNYLMFEPSTYQHFKSSYSPISHAWDSKMGNVMSFSDGIQEMILNLSSTSYEHGARVDRQSTFQTWRKLFLSLWQHSARQSTGKLNGGLWRNSVFYQNTNIGPSYAMSYQDIKGYGRLYYGDLYYIDQDEQDSFANEMILEGLGPPPENQEPKVIDADDGGGLNWIVIDLFEKRE